MELALITTIDSLDSSELLMLFDLTALFDTVAYDIMTHCLTDMGIRRTVLLWFSSFSSARDSEGEWGEVSPCYPSVCGIPQGRPVARILPMGASVLPKEIEWISCRRTSSY